MPKALPVPQAKAHGAQAQLAQVPQALALPQAMAHGAQEAVEAEVDLAH